MLEENAETAHDTSSAYAEARIPHLRGNGLAIEQLGAEPGPRQTDGIVKDGHKRGQEGGRSSRIGRGADNNVASTGSEFPQAKQHLKRKVGGTGKLEGGQEAICGVLLAAGAGAQVDDFARQGDRLGRIAPFRREAVIPAHLLDIGCLARVLAVDEFAASGASEEFDQSHVELCGVADPFFVGPW